MITCTPVSCWPPSLSSSSYAESKPLGFWTTVTSNCSPYATGPLSCLPVALVYCSQTVGWIKMPLGMEVSLGPGDIVLDGDEAPPPTEKGTAAGSPLFGPCLLWPNGRPSQQLLSCFSTSQLPFLSQNQQQQSI